jgi:clan AA aspartic protease
LTIRGPSGAEADVDAVVDTGFSASLTLPLALVADLDLPRYSGASAMLADGTVQPVDGYSAEVHWEGAWLPILAWAAGSEPLAGMRLFMGSELRIEVTSSGAVEVNPLSLR